MLFQRRVSSRPQRLCEKDKQRSVSTAGLNFVEQLGRNTVLIYAITPKVFLRLLTICAGVGAKAE